MDVVALEARLQARSLQMTPQRRAVAAYFAQHPGHPTAAEIHAALSASRPRISLSTVYNTLALFQELEAVKELPQPGGEARYDGTVEPHHHLRCARCGRLHDLPYEAVRIELLRPGLRYTEASVTFEGSCPKGCEDLVEPSPAP